MKILTDTSDARLGTDKGIEASLEAKLAADAWKKQVACGRR